MKTKPKIIRAGRAPSIAPDYVYSYWQALLAVLPAFAGKQMVADIAVSRARDIAKLAVKALREEHAKRYRRRRR